MTEITKSADQTMGQNFNQPVINIGSHPENDIILTGSGVQPFHAALMSERGNFHFVLLSPEAELAIDGKAFTESPVVVNEFDRVGIGESEIMFQSHGADAGIRMFISRMGTAQPIEKFLVEEDQSPIVVEPAATDLNVFVDETAVFELEVINGGPIVASFYLRLEGLPEEWVEIDPPIVNLNEGERKIVYVKVTPPRHYTASAGENQFQVIVSSPNYYGHKVEQDLALTIEPFYAFTLGNLSPRQRRIPFRKASETTRLPITNDSNKTATFNISTYDEENGCTFEYKISDEQLLTRQANLPLQPGEVINLPINIRPHKKSFFAMSAKQYFFSTNVQVQEGAMAPQVTSGVAVAPPLFGWWSLLITFWVLVISAFIIFQPRIHNFGVASGEDVIELGSSTRLEWDVSPFATRLSLTDLDTQIERGQTSLTVAPQSSTTYELIAGNWLSGLVGMDYTRKVTVLVVPPSPRIGVFELDKLEVDKGKPVKVRWSATEVDELILTVDEVVYPLEEGQFSGEQEYILEDDGLITLEAKNASGSELMSYFVDVKPPNIDVLEFTVWVRPAAAKDQDDFRPRLGGSLPDIMRASQVPDPNFPEKLVSLVPDFENELGYRVEIYDPDRELSKGEQIMLSWEVQGVENVEIAPFTDVLPSEGAQPFFPQESMNFVMKAASGELEKIFMLPVKVFDGEPPVAPTIEFFKASPIKMVGAGKVEFAWSVSGEWTNVQLSGADGVLQDGLQAQGFTSLEVEESSTFILTAFNNDLSSAASIEVTIDPDLLPIGLYFKSAFPATGRFLMNQEVAFTVGFYDPKLSDLTVTPAVYVEPEIDPTGQVFVTDGVSLCTITLPSRTCDLKFETPGDPKEITASYSGDDIYLSASTDEPYDQYISVISSTVTLTPTYYLLNRTTPEDSPLSNPILINVSPLSIDTGLYIRVKVEPQGAPLPAPDAGKVNMYICEQETAGGVDSIVPGSCLPYGFASVAMNGNNGEADLVLENFPESGTRALLLSYSATGFEPAERVEFGIVISPIDIYLSMDSCTTPATTLPFPFQGETCEVGTSSADTTKVTFEIRKKDTGERLPAELTTPVLDAFEVYEDIGGVTPWDNCQMAVVTDSGTNYRVLECTVDFSAPPSTRRVYFQYDNNLDNNYIMSSAADALFDFYLVIKQNTFVSLRTLDFAGLKVGELVSLTTPNGLDGAVVLTNSGLVPITPTDGGEIVVTSDVTGTFSVGGNPVDCAVSTDGTTVTIDDITSDCPIYFKKIGDFNLDVTFTGDATYFTSSSNSPLPVSIAIQDEITFDWQNELTPGTYVAWDLPSISPNVEQKIRIEVGGPTGPPPDPVFATNALTGRRVSITLSDPSCSLVGVAGTTYYELNITNTDFGQTPRVDFTLLCTVAPKTLTVTAALLTPVNFSLKPGETTAQSIGVADRNFNYINVNLVRIAGSASMLQGTTLSTLHYGEQYALQLVTGRVWADDATNRLALINSYLATNPVATVTFPAAVFNTIDWSPGKTTCLNRSSITPNTIGVILDDFNVVYDFGNPNLSQPGLTDIELFNNTPCNLYFNTTAPYNAVSGNTTFSFANPFPPGGVPTLSNIATTVDRQTVTLSSNPAGYIGFVDSADTSYTISVAKQIPASLSETFSTSSFGTYFSTSITTTPSNCATVSGSYVSNLPTLTLNPSSDCTGDMTASYLGNAWFKPNTVDIPIEIRKHNPTMNIEYKFPNGNYVPFETPYPNLKVGDTLEMRVEVIKGADALAGTPQPTGYVAVWMVDSNGDKISPIPIPEDPGPPVVPAYVPPYTIDPTYWDAPSEEYQIPLNATFNEALFTINIGAEQTNTRLIIQYRGDTFYLGRNYTSDPIDFNP